MPIPPLDKRGLLPEGIHDASIDEIRTRFAISTYRTALFDDFVRFMNIEVESLDAPIFMAGSYLSDKPLPNDIEITIEVNLELFCSQAGQKIIQLGSGDNHNRLKMQYRVDYYPSLKMPGMNDFTLFFQYVGEKTAHAKGIDTNDKRGIIRVIL